MIGIMQKPTIKQNTAVTGMIFQIKLNSVPIVLIVERKQIRMIEILNVFFSSTHIPKAAEPIMPPIINTAPNTEESDYREGL